MSDISSAGITQAYLGYGSTSRKNVLRRIDVPIVPGAAMRACPMPRGQAQSREQVPARRAGLGRWVPAVDHDQLAPRTLALVLELAAELTPAAVGDHAGRPPVANHVLDGEVLDHDHIGRADKPGASAVQEVQTGVADLAVGAGDLRPGPVGGAFPAAGCTPLVASQVASRIVLLPLRGHGTPSRPESWGILRRFS